MKNENHYTYKIEKAKARLDAYKNILQIIEMEIERLKDSAAHLQERADHEAQNGDNGSSESLRVAAQEERNVLEATEIIMDMLIEEAGI